MNERMDKEYQNVATQFSCPDRCRVTESVVILKSVGSLFPQISHRLVICSFTIT